METWDAIRARRNVRTYQDRPIAANDVDRILEAGWRSPSASNRQPWDFVVVTERSQLHELTTVWMGARHLAEAAAAGYTSADSGAVSRELEAAVSQQQFLANVVAANELELVKSVKPIYPTKAEAKQTGRPWDMSKGFDQSAPIGPLTRGVPPLRGAITLAIDGEIRQAGDLEDMIWSVAEIIASLSTYVAVAAGDLIFTGTPAGVGPIQRGELVRGTIAGIDPVEVTFE